MDIVTVEAVHAGFDDEGNRVSVIVEFSNGVAVRVDPFDAAETDFKPSNWEPLA